MPKAAVKRTDSKRPARLSIESDFTVEEDKDAAKPVAPNWFRLGFLIHDVSRMRRTIFDQRMKPEGITRSQWWVLANLSRHGGNGVQSAQLAKELYVGKVTMGGLVDRLEASGYVFRRADDSDGRAKLIFISPAGYKLIERMRVITEQINKDICRGLSKKDIYVTEKNLSRLKHTLGEMLAEDVSASDDLEDD